MWLTEKKGEMFWRGLSGRDYNERGGGKRNHVPM